MHCEGRWGGEAQNSIGKVFVGSKPGSKNGARKTEAPAAEPGPSGLPESLRVSRVSGPAARDRGEGRPKSPALSSPASVIERRLEGERCGEKDRRRE